MIELKDNAFEIQIQDSGEIDCLYNDKPLCSLTEKSFRYWKKRNVNVEYTGDFSYEYDVIKDAIDKMKSKKEIKGICMACLHILNGVL